MTRWIYALLMWLAQPLLRRKLNSRGRQEPGYLHAMDERFGLYSVQVPPHPGPTVWVHAVSLGETRAAAVLVSALRVQWPEMRLLLTNGTATGRFEGAKLLRAGDLQAWQPWDTQGATQRFLNHFKPTLGILMETEVWPNAVHACRAQGVPLMLVNARLSDKSLRQAQRLAWLARPAYAALTAVWAQTPADAQRLEQLGAPVRSVLGNLKFDATPDAKQLATGSAWRKASVKPVVMFASSREGEELALLQVLKGFSPPAQVEKSQIAIENIANRVQWLIVPRHPQRFEDVAALIREYGFAVQRRSAWLADGPVTAQDTSREANELNAAPPCIWLGDSLGEMALYYGLAEVALLGGSFEPLGGQNLIEAAACGCPVVMGPHTFNFTEAAEQALAAGAAARVPDLPLAITCAVDLVTHRPVLHEMQQASQQFAQAHQGAARQLALVISQELGTTPGKPTH